MEVAAKDGNSKRAQKQMFFRLEGDDMKSNRVSTFESAKLQCS